MNGAVAMAGPAVVAGVLALGAALLVPVGAPGGAARALRLPVTTHPRRLVPFAAGAVALVTVGLDLSTALPVLIGAGVLLGVRHLVRQAGRRRAAEEGRIRVIEACTAIAGDLAAGRPARAALRQAADEWPALAPVATAEELGADVPRALRAVAAAPGAEGLRVVAAAWEVSARSGAGLAETLHELADTLRGDRATALVIASELSSARATARMMAVLPVLTLGLGAGIGGDPWEFLLQTVPGLVCLALGLGLAFLGVAWIDRLAVA